MGYLDQSTNNIILDAVITDAGRRLLASQGRFVITKFALGDDDVNYAMIEQYGRTVGKEKIEKNTPVFEALTNPSIALKNSLVSISTVSNVVTYLPTLSISQTSPISLNFSSKTSQTISAELSISEGFACPLELVDDDVYVYLDNRFLRASSNNVAVPVSISSTSVATYIFPASATSTTNPLSQVSFSITPQSVPQATQVAFKVPGTSYVTTYVTVVGRNSGQRSDIQVNITTSA